MPYTPAHAKAMKKWREKNLDTTREKNLSHVKRYREKWRDFKLETKRLSMIDL